MYHTIKTLRLTVAILSITLLTAFANTARSNDIAPEKHTEIKRMLQLVGLENLMDQMIAQMLDMIRQTEPGMPPEFFAKFAEKAKSKSLIDKIIPLYDRYYTLEDLRAINAFYSSPAGKKILSTLPQVMQESAKLGQEWGEEIGRGIMMELIQGENADKPLTTGTTLPK